MATVNNPNTCNFSRLCKAEWCIDEAVRNMLYTIIYKDGNIQCPHGQQHRQNGAQHAPAQHPARLDKIKVNGKQSNKDNNTHTIHNKDHSIQHHPSYSVVAGHIPSADVVAVGHGLWVGGGVDTTADNRGMVLLKLLNLTHRWPSYNSGLTVMLTMTVIHRARLFYRWAIVFLVGHGKRNDGSRRLRGV